MQNASTDMNITMDSTNPSTEFNTWDYRSFRPCDNGRAVEFEEGAWERAEFIEWVGGYPILTRRTF
jgi:hypothetical protein